ncbi:S-layer homology domain-containing protein [Paenibacillus sp. Soil766]|uniref:S-layer homology domain-containing protein n=1 Tax=Paenibacillus sp. Soil766 TaxID=1736404 RepID=UPI001F3D8BD2|nr:S-layer homology domain-containing protein [Paenibacillus sp. Soil766]
MREKLSVILVVTLLATSVVPVAVGATDSGSSPSPSITEAVYGPGGKNAAVTSIPEFTGTPLSWNLLNKLNHGFFSMIYATYDTPITMLSADEKYLAMMTYPLDDEQASRRKVVALQDRSTGIIQIIRTPDITGTVIHFAMSSDARYFAYTYAEDISSAKVKVYRYDRVADTLELVNGTISANENRLEDRDYVSISADGQYIAFDTEAKGLVPGDTNDNRDVYLYNHSGLGSKLERISIPKEDTYNNDSWGPSISVDGKQIAFVSKAKLTDLEDHVGTNSVYIYDRNAEAGKTLQRISEGNSPSISGDGRYVAFATLSSNLAPGDNNNKADIYVYDHIEESFSRVSNRADGSQHPGDSQFPSISRNGGYVAYEVKTNESQDDSDIYVADNKGYASTKMEVPGSTFPLSTASKRPTVGDTGKTVSFFSTYLEKIGTVEIKLYDYFIAANGTVPVWPSGSTLVATNEGADHITLSWPQASDPDGVTGYAIYKNSKPIAYVPASQARTITLTNQVREDGDDYLFQVEAIDSRYHMSMNGPTYNWAGDGNPGKFFTWLGERGNGQGALVKGSKITIYAGGTPGSEAKVDVSFKEWEGNVQKSKTITIPLSESLGLGGYYSGFFTLSSEATELTAMRLTLTRAGNVEEEAADNLPIPVGGGLQINFTGVSQADLAGAILSIDNPETGQETFTIGDTGIETLSGVWPSDEYRVVLRTQDYLYEMGSLDHVRVEPGRTTSITLPVSMPAQFRVKVLNFEGKPVPYVPVTLWDEKHELLDTRATREDGMTDWREGLLQGQTITAELDLSDLYYELPAGSNLSMKLDGGDNVLTVNVVSLDRGSLDLTVKSPDNKPVFNAYVTATQIYKGKPVVAKARTSLDGRVQFELFAGEVVLEAAEYSYGYSSGLITAQVPAELTTKMDIPVKQPEKGVINLKVFKKALDTEWQGPLDMQNENLSSTIKTNYGWIHTYYSNAVTLGGTPGTPVNVCVSGVIYAFVSVCKNVIMDENSNATAEIRLEEKGARVQGKVQLDRNIYYSATLYELKANGNKVTVANVWDDNFRTTPFNVNVPKAGSYRMEIYKSIREQGYKYRYEYATRDFVVAENQILNLDSISFSTSSYFLNKAGNHFSAQPSRAIPGSTITLRAAYRNNNEQKAIKAALELEIPEGMTLVSDSNGNKAVTGGNGNPITVDERTISVQLGDLAKNDNGMVTYKLAVSPSFDKSSVSVSARMKTMLGTESVDEIIGAVQMDTPKVTLDAPKRVSDANMQTVLSGYAPAGSTISIYDTDVKVGGAVTNAAGIWKTMATLADLGNPSMHALWATTTVNNVDLQSEKEYVQMDNGGPQLLKMAFAQMPDRKWVTVEAGKEAPNFSYTVVPGHPFQFDFEFTNPDLVENVRIYMDGQEGEPIFALREGSLFRAIVPTTHDALGGIYVDYDVKKTQRTYDGALPNMEQIRTAFPPKMRDFEVVSTTPFEKINGVYAGTVELSFPQLNNKKMSIKLTLDPNSTYKPSEEEKALAVRSGVPAIQKNVEVTETDTSFTIAMSGYMPGDLVGNELQPLAGSSAMAATKSGDWGHTAEYFMEIKGDVDGVKEHVSGIKEQYEGYKGYAEKINKIMYNVESSGMDCIEEMPTTAKLAGKALAAVVIGEVAKTALGAWTGAMALTGPGAVVAGAATSVAGDKIDNYVDEQIDAVGSGYNQCDDNPDKKKRKGRLIANPQWIYDPSGYVYEAVKSNPLAGVTATVQYLDTNSGEWKVWKAEEYDQINPQLTDEAGKYGWDVPPGKWRVRWSKNEDEDGDGDRDPYEPLTSAELDVPPPHTEVNAGLVSRVSPKVTTVTGVTYNGGSYVDLTFSKYLKVTDLTGTAVKITDVSDAEVEGAAQFIQIEESASEAGVMLSRTVRFTPKNRFVEGGTYKVKLSKSYYTSYANTGILQGDTDPRSFTVVKLDTTGPIVERAKVESGGRIIRLTFNEPIQMTADPAKFQVNGMVADIVSSAVAVMKRDETETPELLLTMSEPIIEQSTLALLDGAVKDRKGNNSTAGNVSLTSDVNADLSSLTVGSGTLSPVFDSAKVDYSLLLPKGTKELTVTATAAHSNAILKFGTDAVLSGIPRTITIPENYIIPITVSLDGGKLVKTYRLNVSYSSDSTGSSGGSVPATKDPLNLGETARMEKKTASNGGTALVVDIRQDAVAEALKDGKKSKQLYVEVQESLDELILQLPVESMRELNAAQAELIVKTKLMHVKLNAGSVQTSGLAEGSKIRLVIVKAEEQLEKAATEAARAQSDAVKMLTSAVFLHVEAVKGDQVTPISLSEKNMLQGEYPELYEKSAEVYRYDADSKSWIYVPSKKNADGKGLLFDINAPGPYAVMSFTNQFGDTTGHWAQQDIDWMARRLLVNGVSPTAFRPEGFVTRAEFTAMLVRALGIGVNGNSQDEQFTDVNKDAWYREAVLAAASKGLVNGLEAGIFAPDETITREQMAVMISRAFVFTGLDRSSSIDTISIDDFADSDKIQNWARADVELALKEGLIRGMSDAAFEPAGITTRAQAVVVIRRLLNKLE